MVMLYFCLPFSICLDQNEEVESLETVAGVSIVSRFYITHAEQEANGFVNHRAGAPEIEFQRNLVAVRDRVDSIRQNDEVFPHAVLNPSRS